MKSHSFHIVIVIALLFSLIGSAMTITPVRAASFNVITATELIDAITAANSNGQNDTITLMSNIVLATINNTVDGENGLPIILSDGGNSLTINGNGYTISRSSAGGTPSFRFFRIESGANLTLQNLTLSNGHCNGCPGGALNNSGTLTLSNTTFNGNQATNTTSVAFGGAISNLNIATITNSTFSNNTTSLPGMGGAIMENGFLTSIHSSTFNGNASSYGGAIINFGGEDLTISNSTITGNSAAQDGGGVMSASAFTMNIINSTFSDNGANRGANLYSLSSSIILKNTIVAHSFLVLQTNCNDSIRAGADSLATDTSCDLATPIFSSVLNLSPTLVDNGGPTKTLALMPGSPAINAGNATTCIADPINNSDQRGVTRPQGSGCDIGAYEFVPPPPPAITSAVYDASAGTLTVTGTDLLANGSGGDIIANKFTITGEGGSTYTLTDTANVELSTATTFVLTLSATDMSAVRTILNKNGTISTGGTAYNLAAADDWDAGANSSDNIADLINTLTVVNVSVPNIQFATYDATSGILDVFGSRMLSFNGANNDINISKLSITGEGGSTYTLTSGNVEITSNTMFSVTLNTADQDALRQILNKDGTSANDGTTYNLAAADDWNNGADPVLFIQDITGNGITVSNVVPPTLLVTKTDSADPVTAGASMSYTITVQNSGTPNYDAHNVNLTDQLPSGFVVTQTQPSQGSCSPVVGSVLSCALGTIASGTSANVVVTGNYPSNTVSGTITNNIAYVTSAEGNNGNDGNDTPTDNDDERAEEPTTILRQSDLSITKTVDKNPVNENDTLTFELTVSNTGSSQASNVVVTDTLPTGLTYVSFAPNTQPCVYAAPTLTCTFPTLDAGQTQNIGITVTVDSGATSLTPIANTASVTATEPETDLFNNSATVNVIVGAPTVLSQTLLVDYTGTGPNSFAVTFSKEVNNPAGNIDTDDVTNPANFVLIEKGVNGLSDTISCAGGVQTDDTPINVASVTYINPTAIVILSAPLPVGEYRLFICGTTSIVDLGLTPLNGGLSDYTFDFTVSAATNSGTTTEDEEKVTASALPKTGFAPNKITSLPPQPATSEYSNLGDMWLEIPSLNVKSTIVGVPHANEDWDITWLGNNTGWLNGTAFPTWTGNSVLTAHVTNASGLEGPFAELKTLKYGDQIIVHMGGVQYVYEVRETKLSLPYATNFAFQPLQDHSYLTLITCQGYDPINESYLLRRVVRAILVKVK